MCCFHVFGKILCRFSRANQRCMELLFANRALQYADVSIRNPLKECFHRHNAMLRQTTRVCDQDINPALFGLRGGIIHPLPFLRNEFLPPINASTPGCERFQKIHQLLTSAPRGVQSVKTRSYSAFKGPTQLFSTFFFTELLKTRNREWKQSCPIHFSQNDLRAMHPH